MKHLNFAHLEYFWHVAREGGVARAARRLRVSHPTVSTQVKALERALGEKLFVREGRGLALTEMGRVVLRYADDVFAIGRELVEVVEGQPSNRPALLRIGIVDALPKSIARRLLEPTLRATPPVRLVCREDQPERLFEDLARHALDLVLCDAPAPVSIGVRTFHHELGQCGTTWFASPALARKLKRRFPRSLDGVDMVLPIEGSSLRRELDPWFESHSIRPRIRAEVEDSALMKALGADGDCVFPGPSALVDDLRRYYRVAPIATVDALRQRFYAVSAERRLTHPAVLAIRDVSRNALFA